LTAVSGVEMTGKLGITPALVERVVEEETMHALQEVTSLVGHRWEELAHRRTAQTEVESDRGKHVGRVFSRDPVMRFLERGTGVGGKFHHLIVPTRARVLRFADGSYRMVSSGTKPRYYLRRAARELRPEAELTFDNATTVIARRLGRD
jgi:hypothetical protein